MMKRSLLFAALASTIFGAMAQGGYKDGIDYFKADFPDEAAIILNNTISDPATDKALANYYLGAVALKKDNKAEAAKYFEAGMQADPKCGLNYIGQGQIALLNGNEGEAGKLIGEGIACNKKDGALYAAAARAYFDVDPVKYAKKIEKYIADGQKATKFKSADIFILQGDMVTNNAGEAAGLYETAIVTDEEMGIPTSPAAYVKYANVYFRVNPKFAIDKLKELNAKQPNSALAQRALAEKYYDNNQLTMAADEYAKYMANPNHFEQDEQRYAGLLYFGQKYDKSLDVALGVLKKNPDNYFMQRMVMYDLCDLKRYDDAEAAATKFFAMTPKADLMPKDYETYGDILNSLNKPEEAIQAYQDGIKQFPDRGSLLKPLAAAYNHNNQFDLAAQTMQKFVDGGDASLNDLWDLADYYKNWGLSLPEGSPERAQAAAEGVKAIDSAIEKAPSAGQLYRTKSQLFQVANSEPNLEAAEAYKKMIECYEAAGEVDKRKGQVIAGYMYMGQYYAFQKDMAQAREYYQKALDLDPTNEGLAKYLETLK